jgi:hypothetical protein
MGSRYRTPNKEVLEYIKENYYYQESTGKLFVIDKSEGKYRYKVCTRKHTLGYLIVRVCKVSYASHRVIWFLYYGVWPTKALDHIDHVKHNNKIENLREVTTTENNRNMPLSSKNTSGYPGVYWNKKNKVWQAKIWIGQGWKHLGCFKILQDAVDVRKSAEIVRGYHPNHGKKKI